MRVRYSFFTSPKINERFFSRYSTLRSRAAGN
jgi:hypothetical protein